MEDKKWESIQKVHEHALKIVGKKVKDIVAEESVQRFYKNPKNKGWLGNVIESDCFGIANNSRKEADFTTLGLELKVFPIQRVNIGKKTEKWSAKERLVLGIIDFKDEYSQSFETASFMRKAKEIELIYYEYESNKVYTFDGKDRADYPEFTIKAADLFNLNSLPKEDLAIIRQDWETIVKKIKDGKAHELSDSLTRYLAATTKGAKTEQNMTIQPFSTIKAHRRAFTLKQKYMSVLIKEKMGEKFEKAIHNVNLLEEKTFEEIICEAYKPLIGKTKLELGEMLGVEIREKDDKASSSILAKKMLNLQGDIANTEEFQKAGIEVKVVTVARNKKGILNNKTTEGFKLKNYFDPLEVYKQTFEESIVYDYLSSSRFLLVIWEKTSEDVIFRGVKFWSIPYEDLEVSIRECYSQTQKVLKEGVVLTYKPRKKPTKKGKLYEVENNLPGVKNKLILHVRPDAQYAQYSAPSNRWNGEFKKDGSRKIKFFNNAMELPVDAKWINRPKDCIGPNINEELNDNLENKWMTKQAFWLNNDYMYNQIKEFFE